MLPLFGGVPNGVSLVWSLAGHRRAMQAAGGVSQCNCQSAASTAGRGAGLFPCLAHASLTVCVSVCPWPHVQPALPISEGGTLSGEGPAEGLVEQGRGGVN